MRKVLFVCIENACRSQMAAALARYLGGDKIDALSGGSEPAQKVNPLMQTVMADKGIDLAFARTRSLDDAIAVHRPEMIVTMGCGEACPVIPVVKVEDWDLPDPADQPESVMREVRDEIEMRVKNLIEQI